MSLAVLALVSVAVQADMGAMHHTDPDASSGHSMFHVELGERWRLAGMAQAFPVYSFGSGLTTGSPLDESGVYLTQPAAMLNLERADGRFALRVTPNFEAWTQEEGELTYGGWGEGFIDSRHPHTLLHEAMASINFWDENGGGFSFSFGKGFAPYGTDDPMSRPSVKYPTNHHLSQILERFTFNAVLLRHGWGVEAGIFGGSEPVDPYDLSNIESFGDSWSMRLSRRFGADAMARPVWELSGSFARVAHGNGNAHGREHEDDHEEEAVEPHDEGPVTLVNGALRFESSLAAGRRAYGLLEFSRSEPAEEPGYWSALGEASLTFGPHTPYLRYEHATRPEYPREAESSDGFFRYDHDAEPIGATEWRILSVGYGVTATTGGVSVRPFVEGQFFLVDDRRGEFGPAQLFGDDRFVGLTLGMRMFFGGDPMRMGGYGVLDPVTRMGRSMRGAHTSTPFRASIEARR